jgi:hypothetical protein
VACGVYCGVWDAMFGDCKPMIRTDELPCVTIAEAERLGMDSGDVLLWKAWGWDVPSPLRWLVRLPSALIGCFGRSGVSHAAMLRREGSGWRVMESLQWHGVRERPLEDYVREEPGRILWLQLNHAHFWEFGQMTAVSAFRRLFGRRYGWWHLVYVGLVHLPVGRLLIPFFLKSIQNDYEHDRWPPFCSEAVSYAMRAGGVDPVPNLGDRWTEPGDLLRSNVFQPACVLVSSKKRENDQ